MYQTVIHSANSSRETILGGKAILAQYTPHNTVQNLLSLSNRKLSHAVPLRDVTKLSYKFTHGETFLLPREISN